jgi:hypothetical protein
VQFVREEYVARWIVAPDVEGHALTIKMHARVRGEALLSDLQPRLGDNPRRRGKGQAIMHVERRPRPSEGGYGMPFENNNSPGPRPSTHWNNVDTPLTREFTPLHEHEFGMGGDIQYKDPAGVVQARMDGLKPEEIEYLRQRP